MKDITKDKVKKNNLKQSAAAQNTVRVAENWLRQFMKDLGGDSDPPSTGVISGYTQVFLWSYMGGPGHTQDHSWTEHTLSVPSALLTYHKF